MTDDTRFAVYVVIVEDTERADMALAQEVDSLDRIGEDLTYSEAEDILRNARSLTDE